MFHLSAIDASLQDTISLKVASLQDTKCPFKIRFEWSIIFQIMDGYKWFTIKQPSLFNPPHKYFKSLGSMSDNLATAYLSDPLDLEEYGPNDEIPGETVVITVTVKRRLRPIPPAAWLRPIVVNVSVPYNGTGSKQDPIVIE